MRYLYVSLVVILTATLSSAEEMPLPYSTNDLRLDIQTLPKYEPVFEKTVTESIDEFLEAESSDYSARSLGRFRKKSVEVAQTSDEFPTDYMQEPPLDRPASAQVESGEVAHDSPADIPPAPDSTEYQDVPPAPTDQEIKEMFGDSDDTAPAPSSVKAAQNVQLQFAIPAQSIRANRAGCTQ